ncbi:MAG: hypothetical protein Q8M17_07425 [Actinomycetota bacterium]|nr:hypothetical protein [Actinomycetota bacterium]
MPDDTALEAHANGELKSHRYEHFMSALSTLLIVNLILTVIFVLHFLVRLKPVRSKSTYFFGEFGWADLLAMVTAKDPDGRRTLEQWKQITDDKEPR